MLSSYFSMIIIAICALNSYVIQVIGKPAGSTVITGPQVYVFGHRVPDTDTIATSIAYANFLRQQGINAHAYRLGDLNRETQYILNNLGVQEPDLLPNDLIGGTEVNLIDHNEEQQSMTNLKKMKISRVIDHHRIDGLATASPVYLRFEPVGCTATIVGELYYEHKVRVNQTIAALLISAILSDTLNFRSITTTDKDRYIVQRLRPISGIKNLDDYSTEMFKAKSDLRGLSTQQILLMDYKTYFFNDQKWGIGVSETWYPSYLLDLKDQLLEEIVLEKARQNVTGLLFSIIDMINEKNLMLIVGEPEHSVVEAAFSVSVTDNIADLGPRLSRKAQIVPPLETYFNNLIGHLYYKPLIENEKLFN